MMNAYVPALNAGGNVMAIVPSTFEETFRMARAVVASGLAPAALTNRLSGDDAASAVAVAIMSGAELGLKPMVSLRSFTVINGKPALYGDGLINVVRQSGKVTYLRTGCDVRDGQMIGWCEAKRNDTDEDKRVEFSQADAAKAGLWQTSGNTPWAKYPQRMLAWRAAGYCLRELFGDVLGGIRDEFEAREIADTEDMRDITPVARAQPPKPPAPPSAAGNVIDAEPEKPAEETAFDLGEYLEQIEIAVAGAKDEASVEEAWNEFDAPATLETAGHGDMIDAAYSIRDRRLSALSTVAAG